LGVPLPTFVQAASPDAIRQVAQRAEQLGLRWHLDERSHHHSRLGGFISSASLNNLLAAPTKVIRHLEVSFSTNPKGNALAPFIFESLVQHHNNLPRQLPVIAWM